MLALPQQGGAPRARPVVPEDHRLRAGAARRPGRAGGVACAGEADAGQLDWPLRGRACGLHLVRRRWPAHRRDHHRLHHAARHAVRVHVLSAGPRARAGGAPRGGHRVRGRLRGGARGGRGGHGGGAHEWHARQAWRLHGALRAQPGQRRQGARVGGRLRPDRLRHRCCHGCAVGRPARFRVRAQVRPAHRARGRGRRRSAARASGG